ncbi:hypothetical protein J3R30DRAFT_3637354 [Lentinula aciculospora]|uniref:Transcription factor domain-containing protein n=1 Tax=Lentinula aciculospora TaxID=153920 RepID=A0A9W8ZRS6_9AGAR|nr:hypothetical protein J3R30DRAFT_3637354 [Lentinula aciculospora]
MFEVTPPTLKRQFKCDGQHPSCSQCLRRTKASRVVLECIYEKASQTHKQTLEDTVHTLEARIHQLKGSEPDVDSIPHQRLPKSVSNSTFSCSSVFSTAGAHSDTSAFDPTIIQPLSMSHGACITSPPTSSYDIDSFGGTVHEAFCPSLINYSQELPSDTAIKLIESFLPHAQSFGFFLDIPCFRKSASLALPLGHYSRPFPGLLSAVYLVGFRLSNPSADVDSDCAYLSRALLHVANAISSPHPMHILHGIQAEILLCLYFFHIGRIMEGKHHLNSAVSLALCSGYQKRRSNMFTGNPESATSLLESLPRRDSVTPDDAMRSVPSMAFECHDSNIDTPWPRDDNDVADPLNFISTPFENRATVKSFLNGIPMMPPSLIAPSIMELYAKSSILLQRSTDIAASYSPSKTNIRIVSYGTDVYPLKDRLSDGGRHFLKMFLNLDSLIRNLQKQLQPFFQSLHTSSDFPLVFATSTITNVAIINLHACFGATNTESRKKTLSAVKRCVELVRQAKTTVVQSLVVNPFFGQMWTSVCQVLIDEVGRQPGPMEGSSSSMWTAHNDLDILSKKELVAMLKDMFEVMGIIAMSCPLINA